VYYLKSKNKWILWTVVMVLLTNCLTFFVARNPQVFSNNYVVVSKDSYDTMQKFGKMLDVRSLLYKYYDGKIDDNTLVEGAIKGMTSSLKDPYTVFMNQKEYSDFNSETVGSYVGVGLQVGVKDNKIVVIAPIDNSPAKKAGILTGDVIEKVEGKVETSNDLDSAVAVMKGKEGAAVTLTLSRPGKGSFDVKLIRSKVTMVTVNGEMLSSNIGLISISMFDENTGKNFDNKLKELKNKGMKGLILDLRGNPGGLLDMSVDVASNFITSGKVVVSTIDKYKSETKELSKGGIAIGMPLVILTDGGTASASEIVSGAIRDYKAGTLIGVKTFGKGIVQGMQMTGDGTALKVTIAKYYTPSGENIQGTGIKPDIEVVYPSELASKPYNRTTDPQFQKALEVIKDKIK
jgi:carboxyl-terminal processing protease